MSAPASTPMPATTSMAAPTSNSFLGADVDGLDKLSQEFQVAAEIVNAVRAACEVIVAAASIFGPFGAAFVAYLKTTVIPWLTKIGEALTLMSRVLAHHSQDQKDASSSSTSITNTTTNTTNTTTNNSAAPTYSTPANLPTTSTHDYPTLPSSGPGSAVTDSPATPGASSVTTPASIGGTVATPGAPAGDPTVQQITAITGLVTAVDHLIHPGSSADGAADGSTGATVGGTGIDGTNVVDPGAGATGSGGAEVTSPDGAGALGSVPSITDVGSTPGAGAIDIDSLHPLHPGDTVGVLSVPVDIAPDGTVTPLGGASIGPGAPAVDAGNAAPVASTPIDTVSATPASLAPAVHTMHLPTHDMHLPSHDTSSGSGATTGGASTGGGGSDSGSGAGSLGGGGLSDSGGGSGATAPASLAPAAITPDAVTTAAHHAVPTQHAAAEAGPLTTSGAGSSHAGLYAGIGQATGLGAGGAAVARAALREARQRAEHALNDDNPLLPSDAGANAGARSGVLDGELA